MAESDRSKSGKFAYVFNQTLGAMIEGDGVTALADNSWFRVAAEAAVSSLPYGVDRIFKTPDSGNAITPAVGDNVYPITLDRICKVDATVNGAKGEIEVTDDCSEGYIEMITDGLTSLSGDITAYLKYKVFDGSVNTTQLEYMKRFFDVQDDDGAGTYALTAKNDTDILLAVLQNSDEVEEGDIQVWVLIPSILTSITLGKPLKGAQSFDSGWSKGEGPACVYNRTTNSEESAF